MLLSFVKQGNNGIDIRHTLPVLSFIAMLNVCIEFNMHAF